MNELSNKENKISFRNDIAGINDENALIDSSISKGSFDLQLGNRNMKVEEVHAFQEPSSEAKTNEVSEEDTKINIISGFKCDHCGKKFSHQSKLTIHVNAVHFNWRPFNCEICEATFKRKDGLKKHKESIHAKEESSFPCNECNSSFKRMDHLENHVNRMHLNIKPLHKVSCTFLECDKTFECQSHLNRHVNSIHLDKAESYTCSSCTKTFSSQGQLNRHVRTVHLKFKTYVCKICDSTFYQKSNLDRHQEAKHN